MAKKQTYDEKSRIGMRVEFLEKMRRIQILQLQQKVMKRIRQELFQEIAQI